MLRLLRRTTLVAAVSALAPLFARGAAADDVTLLPGGAGRVRFAIQSGALALTPVGADGLVQPNVPGCMLDGAAGGPALPMRTVTIAVPPEGDVSVTATALDPESRDGVDVAPTAAHAPQLPGGFAFPRRADLFRGAPPAAPRATIVGVSWLRNQRIAQIAVRVADWDPASRRLTKWNRIEVDVEVSGRAATAFASSPAELADPFETIYRESLLNYEQGRSWRRSAASLAGARASRASSGGARTLALPPDSSVFAGRTWIKLAISQAGFYRVNFGQIRNLSLFGGDTTVAIDSLRLFTMPGVPVLPEHNYCDTCDYREVAFRVKDNGDGKLNRNTDEIEFYALGVNDWANVFDPDQPDTLYINDPYETKNYYYLTVSTAQSPVRGPFRRVPAVAATVDSSGAEISPVTFVERQHYEQDVEYLPDLSPKVDTRFTMPWQKFFWRSIGTGQQLTVPLNTPGMDVTQPTSVRAHVWGVGIVDACEPDLYHRLTVNVSGNLHADSLLVQPFALEAPDPFLDFTDVLPATGNSVQILVNSDPACTPRVDRVAIAWVEVRYPRRFEPVTNELTFESPAAGGNYIYHLGPFASSTPPQIFDVTRPDSVVELLAPGEYRQDASGDWYLRFETNESGRRRYRVLQSAGIATLPDAQIGEAAATSLSNLRSTSRSAQYLLLYYDGFQQAAEELRLLRTRRLPLDGASAPFDAQKIPISAVFDQFSGGRVDPLAIRNFLRSVFYNWRANGAPPAFVTLLGDASYDFKNILGRAPSGQPGAPMPSFEDGWSINRAFATDDVLLNVDNPDVIVPDFFGGRIPVSSATSALEYVRNKVVRYEEAAPLGAYRNRVMLIADDNLQGAAEDGLHWAHVGQTSEIDTTRVPRELDRDYVYLHKYPTEAGFTKPTAKAAIKANVNRGVAAFNFIGHGSPFQLADERVLLDVDAGTFENDDRLPLFVAASCDVGKFNDPVVPSLGERTLLAASGGAVAVISATELAFSTYNVDLATQFYRTLFDRTGGGGRFHGGIAPSLLAAKIATGITPGVRENNQKYQVMGDAALGMNLPKYWADVQLFDCATCTTPLTEIRRGRTVTVRGRVLDRPGGSPLALNGIADLLVEDSPPYERTSGCVSIFCDEGYFYTAGAIFRGDVRVQNGEFTTQFIVPLEAAGGAYARARAYVQGRVSGDAVDSDGTGSARLQLSAGTPSTSDNTGPEITLSFTGGATAVKKDATLRIDLFDESGILITDHNPQNGIIVTIDGNTTSRVDVTSTFRYAAGSYQSGSATFALPNLSLGPHTVQVCAADNFAAGLSATAHRACATLSFTVAETPPLQLVSAYLFPNPARSSGGASGGQFVVDARGDSVNALLRIYTSSGRLIRTLRQFGGVGQIQIPWDGRDAEGDALANGVYFFRVQLNARDEEGNSSALQKATADGRFVIVNP